MGVFEFTAGRLLEGLRSGGGWSIIIILIPVVDYWLVGGGAVSVIVGVEQRFSHQRSVGWMTAVPKSAAVASSSLTDGSDDGKREAARKSGGFG